MALGSESNVCTSLILNPGSPKTVALSTSYIFKIGRVEYKIAQELDYNREITLTVEGITAASLRTAADRLEKLEEAAQHEQQYRICDGN